MLRFITFLAFTCLLAGCTATGPTSRGAKILKVSEPYELKNTITVDGKIAPAWDAAKRYFTHSQFITTLADKRNNVFKIEFNLYEPSKYIDCGTFISMYEDRQQIQYIQQITNTGPQGSDRVFGEATISLTEEPSGTRITVMAEINFQITLRRYLQDVTHTTETRYSSHITKIDGNWVTISTPYTVEVPKYGPLEVGYETETRTARTVYIYNPENENRIGRWGFDCHSTQELEQMILQGIAEELQKEKIQ